MGLIAIAKSDISGVLIIEKAFVKKVFVGIFNLSSMVSINFNTSSSKKPLETSSDLWSTLPNLPMGWGYI